MVRRWRWCVRDPTGRHGPESGRWWGRGWAVGPAGDCDPTFRPAVRPADPTAPSLRFPHRGGLLRRPPATSRPRDRRPAWGPPAADRGGTLSREPRRYLGRGVGSMRRTAAEMVVRATSWWVGSEGDPTRGARGLLPAPRRATAKPLGRHMADFRWRAAVNLAGRASLPFRWLARCDRERMRRRTCGDVISGGDDVAYVVGIT